MDMDDAAILEVQDVSTVLRMVVLLQMSTSKSTADVSKEIQISNNQEQVVQMEPRGDRMVEPRRGSAAVEVAPRIIENQKESDGRSQNNCCVPESGAGSVYGSDPSDI